MKGIDNGSAINHDVQNHDEAIRRRVWFGKVDIDKDLKCWHW